MGLFLEIYLSLVMAIGLISAGIAIGTGAVSAVMLALNKNPDKAIAAAASCVIGNAAAIMVLAFTKWMLS